MDRFIVTKLIANKSYLQHLKSNMDRFIDDSEDVKPPFVII